ncbi:hypothetical protein BK720_06820 [Bacillus thuringiensis serovar brasilensis]|uniref:DUF1835 domain-containing protein n=1 Tax=Bacillus cereus group TaxID=86661 RepID=UPI000A369AA0|nr:DUF1835 domain-containing protein [Bacillus thuringiensis]MCU5032215.1 DUF1835 domain-containing protein [Bacillus cereus]MRA75307.1 DUF1835 domain-containing protein [Bacillus thuringiensis]MRA93796.1 DUF1835 domain-containing protein [Bacillus thuringiensis]MRC56518.1 DUF1835 domain-containing protein [Bacillus thuringiensis]OTX35838.1 hypothetical protein BK720_06820 [Bacillus thuringiensis serovar brasilensis]
MNVIHIGFGDSACGNLKSAFSKNNEYKNEQIICINEDFSIGPIYKLESNKGLQERKQWLKEVLTKTGSILDKDYLGWIEITLNKNSHIAKEIPTDSKVIIWHGDNASDQIGLRFVAFLLQNNNIQFEEVNVTEYSRQIEYKVHDLQNKEIPHVIKSLGEMPPELTLDALQLKKSMSSLTIESLINDWEKWAQTKDVLRIILKGKIVAVPEDYYDLSILENTLNEYQNASHIVGDVMGESDQRIGDTYLAYRVYQLIQQGKLSYQGDLGFLRKFEIRLP